MCNYLLTILQLKKATHRMVYRFLPVHFWIVGSAKKIINGHIKIICNRYQRFIICFQLFTFISADISLCCIQLHWKSDLRNLFLFSYFFQPENTNHFLDKIISKWHNLNIHNIPHNMSPFTCSFLDCQSCQEDNQLIHQRNLQKQSKFHNLPAEFHFHTGLWYSEPCSFLWTISLVIYAFVFAIPLI